MAYKTLLFGTDDLFETLKPFYVKAAEQGVLEIVAAAVFENGKVNLVTDKVDTGGGNSIDIDLAIISSDHNFYDHMKQLEAMGIPRNRIIDGRVFKVPNLDFPRLLKEGVAYGSLNVNSFPAEDSCCRRPIYPRIYTTSDKSSLIQLGVKSCINGARFGGDESRGAVIVGKFSQISWSEIFEFDDGGNNPARGHHLEYLTSCNMKTFDWEVPPDIFIDVPLKQLQILIGNDVWIGCNCILKVTKVEKPLIIGDGAVIASDSVVVKNVPPYAIVGGNPAKIIKYRFEPHVIESLLRIKWWDWDIDKIHDNFKYFNDVEKFISLHDKEG